MPNSDDFNHDPDYKYFGTDKLDSNDMTYAGKDIAYNHRENFGGKWGVYGTSKSPMRTTDVLFDQWRNSSGHDRNMLVRNDIVGVGVHIMKYGNLACIHGTQKFYTVIDGSPSVSHFHTTGDTASIYNLDGTTFNTDNTSYVSGLASGGDVQRVNSWQNKAGSLPGVALPINVLNLLANAGSIVPTTSTSAPADIAPSTECQQAMIDTQTSVNAAQAALDEYLAPAEEREPATSLVDIDAELDCVTESITSQTAVRLEKDGGVTLQDGENVGHYLTAIEYRGILTRCATLSVRQDGNNLSMGGGIGSMPDQQAPSDETPASTNGDESPFAGQEPGQTPTPSVPSAAPSAPASGGGDPASEPPALANDDGNPSVTPSTPVNGDAIPAAPETSTPTDDQGAVTTHLDITPSVDPTQVPVPAAQDTSTPMQARADAFAATGASFVWMGVGAVVALIARTDAVVASRRAKR